MTLKKFFAPNLIIILLLSLFWALGTDSVVVDEENHQQNLKKYLQAQRKIVDNYVDKVDLDKLYKASIKGLLKGTSDSTLTIEGSPLDTTFKDTEVSSIRESFAKYEEAYLYLANNKSDTTAMSQITEASLRNMFRSLDPHSVYIEPKDSKRIQEEFEGKFQGIGIQFDIIQDTITVITAISGGPSDQLGIMSGDKIIKINDESAVGFDNNDVINTLRGEKGSTVHVTIKRPNVEESIGFDIVRDDIPLKTVDTYYMMDDKTGYIKINRFAATTHEEFMNSMNKLKDKGMERLILDLRSNPGGYLTQAIAIAEEFFPKDTKLVSTKSRHKRFTSQYYSRKEGTYTEKPLVVLINEASASASEIVSGAVQDHDRGLIVGSRSFGKGLVQQQYELADNSNIRVTISRYYTPSGRLIQKPFEEGREDYVYEIYQREDNSVKDAREFIEDVPDSLQYRTDGGRIVYGGGGIVPDHIIQNDTTRNGAVFNFMRRKRVGFNYINKFLDEKDSTFVNKWKGNYTKFRNEFSMPESELASLEEVMKENGLVFTDTLSSPEFKNDSLFVTPAHYDSVEWMLDSYMKAEIGRQIWDMRRYYQLLNDAFDTTLDKTMELWAEVRALEKVANNRNSSSKQNSKSIKYN